MIDRFTIPSIASRKLWYIFPYMNGSCILHEWVWYIFPYMFMVDFYGFSCNIQSSHGWVWLIGCHSTGLHPLFPKRSRSPRNFPGLRLGYFLSKAIYLGDLSSKMKLTKNSKMLSLGPRDVSPHRMSGFFLLGCILITCETQSLFR